jgi:hypothetical protein
MSILAIAPIPSVGAVTTVLAIGAITTIFTRSTLEEREGETVDVIAADLNPHPSCTCPDGGTCRKRAVYPHNFRGGGALVITNRHRIGLLRYEPLLLWLRPAVLIDSLRSSEHACLAGEPA